MNCRSLNNLFAIATALVGATFWAHAADGPDQKKEQPVPPPHPFGREVALTEVKKMTVADGLEVTLFACEPDLVNPCDMDIDARGRVWITEGANYRSSFQKWGLLRPAGDRIVVL